MKTMGLQGTPPLAMGRGLRVKCDVCLRSAPDVDILSFAVVVPFAERSQQYVRSREVIVCGSTSCSAIAQEMAKVREADMR